MPWVGQWLAPRVSFGVLGDSLGSTGDVKYMLADAFNAINERDKLLAEINGTVYDSLNPFVPSPNVRPIDKDGNRSTDYPVDSSFFMYLPVSGYLGFSPDPSPSLVGNISILRNAIENRIQGYVNSSKIPETIYDLRDIIGLEDIRWTLADLHTKYGYSGWEDNCFKEGGKIVLDQIYQYINEMFLWLYTANPSVTLADEYEGIYVGGGSGDLAWADMSLVQQNSASFVGYNLWYSAGTFTVEGGRDGIITVNFDNIPEECVLEIGALTYHCTYLIGHNGTEYAFTNFTTTPPYDFVTSLSQTLEPDPSPEPDEYKACASQTCFTYTYDIALTSLPFETTTNIDVDVDPVPINNPFECAIGNVFDIGTLTLDSATIRMILNIGPLLNYFEEPA